MTAGIFPLQPGSGSPTRGFIKPNFRKQSDNPFVEISIGHRNLVILYFVFWRFVPDTVLLLKANSASTSVLGLTLLCQYCLTACALLPFLVKSFGGLPMGWLNPLALASILDIVRRTIKEPLHALEPFLVWFREPVRLQHRLLVYWTDSAVQWVNVKTLAMGLLASLAYLGVFYFAKFHRRSTPDKVPHEVPSWYFVLIFAVLLAAFAILISLSGGVVEHLNSLSQGRFKVRQNTGVLLVAVGFMPVLLVIWYLLKPAVLKSPVYWIMLFLALSLQFISDGSRSSILIPVVILLAGWMFKNRKVPALAGVFGMIFAILILAMLGSLRASSQVNEGQLDFASLTEFDLPQILHNADNQIMARNEVSGAIAIAALVPRERDWLYGRTYIGAIGFWIPRIIWTDKPRGSGAYVSALLFQKRKSVDGYQGPSFPSGASGEAYWNFGWFGIIVVFGLFGLFHRWITDRVMQNPADPEYLATLLIGVIILGAPDTDTLVPFMQSLVLLMLTFFGMRLFPTKRQHSGVKRIHQ